MGPERENRWNSAQVKENAFWHREGVFESQMERVISRYGPVINKLSEKIQANSNILDVGCGPTCTAQLFSRGLKIFLDPLMDSYRKVYSELLPEGYKISCTAENISLKNECADVVVCVNALDHMIAPDKALYEMGRVLKKEGMFVLGIFLHPPLIAIARRFIERFLPIFREDAHPYSYTLKGIRDILKYYFSIQEEVLVYRKDSALVPSIHREDWIFICRKG